jgi:hypothetical protein
MERFFNSKEILEAYSNASEDADETRQEEETEETEDHKSEEETDDSEEGDNQESTEEASEETEETEEGDDAGEPDDILESVDFPGIRKVGSDFVFIVDPDNPKSTVYKGKTAAELLSNIQKGLKAKDTYIQDLKKKGEMVEEPVQKEETPKEPEPVNLEVDVDDEPFPDGQAMFQAALKKRGIDVAVAQWGREEWKNYEEENTASEAFELRQELKRAQEEATQQYNTQTSRVLNNSQLKEETEAVKALLSRYQISPKNFDYKSVLKRVQSDKDNFYENGIRRSGTIVREAMNEIHEHLTKQISNKASSDVNLKFRKTLDKVKKASSGTPKGSRPKPKPKTSAKPALTTKDVTRELKELARQGKLK